MLFRKTFFTSIFLLLSSPFCFSQNLSAYTDYKNYFYVFDDGASKLLEYNPIQSYKVGGNAVAYIDNSFGLKAYYMGETYDLFLVPSEVVVTDDLVVYYSNNILKVFDSGTITHLTNFTTNYAAGDSIVGFFDNNISILKVYYDNTITDLENVLGRDYSSGIIAGDNILAYKTFSGHFNVFYSKQMTELENSFPISYLAGNNTVAYVDAFTQNFKVFYKGTTYLLETFKPKSYKVADDMVAYIDNTGHFKLFYKGSTTEISSFEPAFYNAEDNLLLYSDNISFKVVYKGKTFTLENYIPSDYQMDLNTLVYKDKNGYLNVFSEGKTVRAYSEKISTYQLNGNNVKFSNSMNEWHFFLNGKMF